jgi:hypothetical protein
MLDVVRRDVDSRLVHADGLFKLVSLDGSVCVRLRQSDGACDVQYSSTIQWEEKEEEEEEEAGSLTCNSASAFCRA